MREVQENKVDNRVWFYLPPETHRKIKALAKADDRSVANWLRRTVEQRLRSEQTEAA
jgi:predicted DNA-binding protein